ncbi:MAG: glycosyltransferase family 39 protein [bacterium]|nr:glycosyltransferase family 39 protein [bacterium]
MSANLTKIIRTHSSFWFLFAVLLFVNIYSLSTLTTKPAYWYDEAINVELARNFSDFGKLDLVVAPNTFSEQGATVGSTGFPVTVPLAGFFKLFGFGLTEARAYMLIWMSALIIVFFFIARELWGPFASYGGTLLLATFAPFYGNGRSVMGEIPGFLFFLCAYYLFERKKWLWAGFLLGLAVVSKPSVYLFLIPAFALVVLLQSDLWKRKLVNLIAVGFGAVLALVPWFAIYASEVSRGGLAQNILNHFKNPYAEAGVSALTNIHTNLPTLLTSTTLLYMWVLLFGVIIALCIERGLLREHKNILILSLVYIPLSLVQYLKSFGYLRYLIATEFLIFLLFLLALPALARFAANLFGLPRLPAQAGESGDPAGDVKRKNWIPVFTGMTVAILVLMQTVHLFAFSDLYASEKTQKTILYLYTNYPTGTIGVVNVPQIASFIPSFQKYQSLSTYGLWNFGPRILYLSGDKLPSTLVTESGETGFSAEEKEILNARYTRDSAFTEGFSIYTRK